MRRSTSKCEVDSRRLNCKYREFRLSISTASQMFPRACISLQNRLTATPRRPAPEVLWTAKVGGLASVTIAMGASQPLTSSQCPDGSVNRVLYRSRAFGIESTSEDAALPSASPPRPVTAAKYPSGPYPPAAIRSGSIPRWSARSRNHRIASVPSETLSRGVAPWLTTVRYRATTATASRMAR